MTDVRWSTVEHTENVLDSKGWSNDRKKTAPAMHIFIITRMVYFDRSQLPHLSLRECKELHRRPFPLDMIYCLGLTNPSSTFVKSLH